MNLRIYMTSTEIGRTDIWIGDQLLSDAFT